MSVKKNPIREFLGGSGDSEDNSEITAPSTNESDVEMYGVNGKPNPGKNLGKYLHKKKDPQRGLGNPDNRIKF